MPSRMLALRLPPPRSRQDGCFLTIVAQYERPPVVAASMYSQFELNFAQQVYSIIGCTPVSKSAILLSTIASFCQSRMNYLISIYQNRFIHTANLALRSLPCPLRLRWPSTHPSTSGVKLHCRRITVGCVDIQVIAS